MRRRAVGAAAWALAGALLFLAVPHAARANECCEALAQGNCECSLVRSKQFRSAPLGEMRFYVGADYKF